MPQKRLTALNFLLLLMLMFPAVAPAAVLRHVVRDTDSPEAMQTQRVCHGLKSTPKRLACLPLHYLSKDDGELSLDATLKANEKGFLIANRIIDKDVDEKFLQSLFEEDSFQASSGVVALRAIYGGTALSYTPVHFVGAFKLSNPSLPEIHVGAVKQTSFRVSHNFLIKPAALAGELLIAPSAYYFDRQYAYLDTDLLSTGVDNAKKQIQKTRQRGGDGDINLAFLARAPYMPSLQLRFMNLAAEQRPCEGCSDRFFDVHNTYATRAEAAVSVFIPAPIGQATVGFNLPFEGTFQQFDRDQTAIALMYHLVKLQCFAAFSPLVYNFGFLFDAEIYRLGVIYSDEKQDSQVQITRQKHTYVFASFYL